MSEVEEAISHIRPFVAALFDRPRRPFVAGQTRIPLMEPGFGAEEVLEALESMLAQRTTMGEKVARFERMFADYMGVKHGVMVTSGSAANLLAATLLLHPDAGYGLKPGDEVITPAVTWATTVFPIAQVGLVPVLVDVDLNSFTIDPDEVERAISPRTRAIMLVHLLGYPCDMDAILDIARRHDLVVIEDACEAHGASIRGERVGSFGQMATFSFFFSHHITTMEGGMLMTNDDRVAEIARSVRVFGWSRALDDPAAVAARYPDIDPRFLFTHAGYNLRPTEIQGAFGIHQLPRLDGYLAVRNENARYWTEALRHVDGLSVQSVPNDVVHAQFGFPVVVDDVEPMERATVVGRLESWGVETRPIMAGNIAEQPAMQGINHRRQGDLPIARRIHRQGFFFGNHHGIGRSEREAIARYVIQAVRVAPPSR